MANQMKKFQTPEFVLWTYAEVSAMWQELMRVLPAEQSGPERALHGMPKTMEYKQWHEPSTKDGPDFDDEVAYVYLFWEGGNAIRGEIVGVYDTHYGLGWQGFRKLTLFWHPKRIGSKGRKIRFDLTEEQIGALATCAYHRQRVDTDYHGDDSHLREAENVAAALKWQAVNIEGGYSVKKAGVTF